MSSSAHFDNKKKIYFDFGYRSCTRIGTYTDCRKMYSINFMKHNKNFCLSLHNICAKNYLFVNGKEIHKFKTKDFKVVATPLCLANISKDWTVYEKDLIKRICL